MSKETVKEAGLKKPRYLDNHSPKHVGSQTRTQEPPTTRDLDREYLVRALSHDVGAHLMILEYSFRQYEKQAKLALTQAQTQAAKSQKTAKDRAASDDIAGEFRAMGGRIVFRHDTAQTETQAPHQSKRPHSTAPARGSDKLSEAALHVTACIDEMRRFVEELIAFAKTGNIDMEPTAVSVADLVAEVLYEQRGLLEKRKIETVVSSPLPTVFANAMRVKQLLTNLVRNAAIHGCDESRPMIVIASEAGAIGDDMAAFYVRDNGRGVPQSECERIFEPGYRVPGNQNDGSGTGLAIVKKIATHYGGNTLCDPDDTGTTFTVTLPRG